MPAPGHQLEERQDPMPLAQGLVLFQSQAVRQQPACPDLMHNHLPRLLKAGRGEYGYVLLPWRKLRILLLTKAQGGGMLCTFSSGDQGQRLDE